MQYMITTKLTGSTLLYWKCACGPLSCTTLLLLNSSHIINYSQLNFPSIIPFPFYHSLLILPMTMLLVPLKKA